MIIQLDPPIPVTTISKGDGLAWFLIDYSCEMHLYWVVAIDDTGELWTFPNPEIRAQKNITMGRKLMLNKIPYEKNDIRSCLERIEKLEKTLDKCMDYFHHYEREIIKLKGCEDEIIDLHNTISYQKSHIDGLQIRVDELNKLLGEVIEDMAIMKSKGN
jgi:hypothetical protein